MTLRKTAYLIKNDVPTRRELNMNSFIKFSCFDEDTIKKNSKSDGFETTPFLVTVGTDLQSIIIMNLEGTVDQNIGWNQLDFQPSEDPKYEKLKDAKIVDVMITNRLLVVHFVGQPLGLSYFMSLPLPLGTY